MKNDQGSSPNGLPYNYFKCSLSTFFIVTSLVISFSFKSLPYLSRRSESPSDTESESSSGRSGSDNDKKDCRVSRPKARNLKDAENKPTRIVGMLFFNFCKV